MLRKTLSRSLKWKNERQEAHGSTKEKMLVAHNVVDGGKEGEGRGEGGGKEENFQ